MAYRHPFSSSSPWMAASVSARATPACLYQCTSCPSRRSPPCHTHTFRSTPRPHGRRRGRQASLVTFITRTRVLRRHEYLHIAGYRSRYAAVRKARAAVSAAGVGESAYDAFAFAMAFARSLLDFHAPHHEVTAFGCSPCSVAGSDSVQSSWRILPTVRLSSTRNGPCSQIPSCPTPRETNPKPSTLNPHPTPLLPCSQRPCPIRVLGSPRHRYRVMRQQAGVGPLARDHFQLRGWVRLHGHGHMLRMRSL
jgi:hypothetical protein